MAFFRRFCAWIARRMIGRAALLTAAHLVVVAGRAIVYSGLEASYRLADEVPNGGRAVAASGRLDAEISGSNPIQVLITFSPGLSLYAPQTLAAIEDVQRGPRKPARSRQRMVARIPSLLRLLGYGLQFAGVIALFVSFGLGLSASIHFLKRMIQERRGRDSPRPAEGERKFGPPKTVGAGHH